MDVTGTRGTDAATLRLPLAVQGAAEVKLTLLVEHDAMDEGRLRWARAVQEAVGILRAR